MGLCECSHVDIDSCKPRSCSPTELFIICEQKHCRMLDYWFIENNWFFADALSSQYSPDTTLALLQTSAAQAEEEAEVNWK